ncbi:MAG: peptidoglycan-binding protein [Salaquimonas sp.]|nr:peptidoglycan-binding protein [Salaquimonas sp.]
MHAMRQFLIILGLAGALAAVGLPLPSLVAQAASREDARILYGLQILVSPGEGRIYLAQDGELLAVGMLGQDGKQRLGMPFEECVPGYGCRSVGGGGYGNGHGGPYFDGYGPQLMLSGRDLALKPVESAGLPMPAGSAAYDRQMDQWRILYERTGRLATNPAPLVSTAALLSPLARIDPVTTASTARRPAAPVHVAVTRRNEREVTADIQKLLNALGHNAGPPDGLAGSNTIAAVRRFQATRGIEVTGRLTPSLIDAIYLAAQKERPPSGRLTVRQAGKTVLDKPINIDKGDEALGTHLFVLSKTSGGTGWRLVALNAREREIAAQVFGFDKKTGQEEAAASALSRLHIPAEIRAKLAAMVAPGATFVLSDERVPEQFLRRY